MLSDLDEVPVVKFGPNTLEVELQELTPESKEVAKKELRETPDVARVAVKELRDLLKGMFENLKNKIFGFHELMS